MVVVQIEITGRSFVPSSAYVSFPLIWVFCPLSPFTIVVSTWKSTKILWKSGFLSEVGFWWLWRQTSGKNRWYSNFCSFPRLLQVFSIHIRFDWWWQQREKKEQKKKPANGKSALATCWEICPHACMRKGRSHGTISILIYRGRNEWKWLSFAISASANCRSLLFFFFRFVFEWEWALRSLR